jgi:uncharacterized protein YgbK (DUF1537 family)
MSFDRVIVAPAFPYQGRVTRNGRQYYCSGGVWTATETDLRADLEGQGFAVALRHPGDMAPAGLSLWDAETDSDLADIAAAGRAASGSALWCGSGGLAGALAGAAIAGRNEAAERLERPVLGLFGTDHPVTVAQIEACGSAGAVLPDGGAASVAEVARRLSEAGVALVRIAMPENTARSEAALRIERELGALVRRLAPPRTLLAAGGETLRALCVALDADRLELVDQLAPGVPCSFLRGGRFDGVRVISKSGAFGDRDLLKRLLALNASSTQGDRS